MKTGDKVYLYGGPLDGEIVNYAGKRDLRIPFGPGQVGDRLNYALYTMTHRVSQGTIRYEYAGQGEVA